MKKITLFTMLLFSFFVSANDQEHHANAMKNTQELLNNRKQREKAVSENPEAQKAHNRVKELAGDQKTEDEYYRLSSEIFGQYQDESSMKKDVEEGLRNPAEFFDKLTPEQKAKIKELSEKINPGAKPNP